MAPTIRISDLNLSIDGMLILRTMSLDIVTGKIVGLLGPSGAGKTTLMRAIVGRVRIPKGSITVLGLPAGAPGLRGRVGYMTQALSIYPDLTVHENMTYFAAILGQSAQEVHDTLAKVDLTGQLDQLVRTLSGGQKSRLSLAIALLGRPEVLVLDEPTVGVDPALRQQLWYLFHDLAAAGATLLISSHVMEEAARCDDLLLIRDGALLAHDAPTELCRKTKTKSIEDAFLALVERRV